MTGLVSVIVPVYMVQKYLEKCITCITNQTYTNIEIILVDDGTSDNSAELCDWYSSSFNQNIITIHKLNGGLSDARNFGLEVASGDYICFFDSDDWVEPELIEKALETLTVNDAKVAIWSYFADFVDESEKLVNKVPHTVPDIVLEKGNNTVLYKERYAMGNIGYAWNKLYTRALIGEQRFIKGISLVEDILFNSPLLCKAKKAVFMKYAGTHYVQRSRETLGNKYYPDFYKLKKMAWVARKRIMKAYQVPPQYILKEVWMSRLITIRNWLKMKKLF